MEDFIRTKLHPADDCAICTEVFSADHQPVALPCKHIFGNQCIKKWMRSGRGANASCPSCRAVMYEKRDPNASFDAPSLWKALCEQPPERLNTFMTYMWSHLQDLWKRKLSGKFSVTELLDKVIIPGLDQTASEGGLITVPAHGVFMDCYNFITASWNSLGRPDRATALAIPLVRLARLISSASTTLPKWMTTVPRTNRLIWTANACMGTTKCDISWDDIVAASQDVASTQHFPLLHLYTLLISQSIAHNARPSVWPTRRHEVMNLVVERCCKKIGGDGWSGTPSNAFKDVLVLVYEELRKFQLDQKKISLRGYGNEAEIVKGIWALAVWSVREG